MKYEAGPFLILEIINKQHAMSVVKVKLWSPGLSPGCSPMDPG